MDAGMDPPLATERSFTEPTDGHYRQTRAPITSQVDVSWHSNTIGAGRDAIFNIIGAGDVHRPDTSTDMRTLANWLSSKNHHKIHKDILEKVTEGTGSWIFEHPKFIDLLSKKTNILWGTGIPGAGKTCLTSIVVEHLVQTQQATVIYIYCQYNDQLSTAEILACMLKQMVEASEKAAQYVSKHLQEKCQRTETEPSKSELLTTLRGASGQFVDVFFVVDALDELKDDVRPELIDDLISLERPLFITSRPLSDFPGIKEPDFSIQAPDKDFRAYISTKISFFPKLSRLLGAPGVRDEIITKIHARCGGMFLLAALQVDALASGGNTTDVRSLREALEHLPTSLDDQYDLTLKRIRSQSTQEQNLAYKAISLVTYATSILEVDELLEALTVDIARAVVDQERRTTEETLIGTCMGLLTIEKETKTVQLIHYTARDFLTRRKEPSEIGDPHTFIANILAVYLNHASENIVTCSILSNKDLLATNSAYPLLHYACSNLGHHTSQANNCTNGQIPTHVIQLFRSRPRVPLPLTLLGDFVDHVQAIHFAAFHGLESLLDENREMFDRKSTLGCSPLFYACLGGHFNLATRILNNFIACLSAGYPTTFGATVLHAASRSGQLDVVNLVLQIIDPQGGTSAIRRLFGYMNVDVNTKMLDGRTALHLSAEYGYVPLVNTFLNNVAAHPKSDIERGALCTSLGFVGDHQTAFRRGFRSPNVDVNAGDQSGRTSLLVAAQNGHELVVQSLLNATGIRVNAANNHGRTPLHFAAQNGHRAVAQLLLNSTGIEVNSKSNGGRTPLYLAASYGHKAIAQLLLNSTGIEVNPKTDDGWTLLHVAVSYGNEAVVQLLLNSTDIEVNSMAQSEGTPLHIAASNGDEAIVRLLLSSTCIKVNSESNSGYTPLYLAASYGHKAVAQLLLNFPDIEVNPKTADGWTPLHMAASNGDEAIVRLLLSSTCIKVNSEGNSGYTPLYLAASYGHKAVAQLLLNFPDIEVNPKTADGWTPLHRAAEDGHEPVVRLLLNSTDLELNARGEGGWTPLHAAALRGHELVVQLLLNSHGIEVNAKSETGWTSLYLAAENGHEGIVQLLLDYPGIELHVSGQISESPLEIARLKKGRDPVTFFKDLPQFPDMKSGKSGVH